MALFLSEGARVNCVRYADLGAGETSETSDFDITTFSEAEVRAVAFSFAALEG